MPISLVCFSVCVAFLWENICLRPAAFAQFFILNPLLILTAMKRVFYFLFWIYLTKIFYNNKLFGDFVFSE